MSLVVINTYPHQQSWCQFWQTLKEYIKSWLPPSHSSHVSVSFQVVEIPIQIHLECGPYVFFCSSRNTQDVLQTHYEYWAAYNMNLPPGGPWAIIRFLFQESKPLPHEKDY